MFPGEDLRLLHRDGEEWHEMRPAPISPADYDFERELARGGRIFECDRCDLRFRVTPVEAEQPD